MADYYEERRKAFRIIEDMWKAGKTEDEINYKIGMLYGFGSSMIEKRILLLERMGFEAEKNVPRKNNKLKDKKKNPE